MSGETVESARFVARRNHSPSPGGSFLVVGSLAVVVLAISLGFALSGAWLVFPFAGVEILVVFLAFRYVERHAGDYECMVLEDERVVVERQHSKKIERYEFNRHWAQVSFTEPRGRARGRLVLRSHGREIEFGVHLNGEQRAAVARRLKEHLRNR
jgi:uncharacterized membrane protein